MEHLVSAQEAQSESVKAYKLSLSEPFKIMPCLAVEDT